MADHDALPTFLVIGAQKAATTTLYELLRQHPDVYVPEVVKETNFLLDDGAWERGIEWYRSLYEDGRDHTHRGDVSPAYSMFPLFRHAPQRAAELMPDAKLVYLIRHPVERMVSAWAQLTGTGFEHRDITDALLHEAPYSQVSCYGLQAEQWLEHFPSESLLILRSEDLATDPDVSIDRLLTHLGLPAGWRPDDLGREWNTARRQVAPPKRVRRLAGIADDLGWDGIARLLGPRGRLGRRMSRPIPDADRRLDPTLAEDLQDLFRADAARLRTLVGPDMDLWGLA